MIVDELAYLWYISSLSALLQAAWSVPSLHILGLFFLNTCNTMRKWKTEGRRYTYWRDINKLELMGGITIQKQNMLNVRHFIKGSGYSSYWKEHKTCYKTSVFIVLENLPVTEHSMQEQRYGLVSLRTKTVVWGEPQRKKGSGISVQGRQKSNGVKLE